MVCITARLVFIRINNAKIPHDSQKEATQYAESEAPNRLVFFVEKSSINSDRNKCEGH